MATKQSFASALLMTVVLAAAARAQSIPSVRSTKDFGPYSVYGPGLTYKQPSFNNSPYATSIRTQTSVRVPDRGQAVAARLGSRSESRSDYAAPAAGKPSFLNRGANNTMYSRSVGPTSITVQAEIIPGNDDERRARPRYVRLSGF
jgi:hypothetical protein